MTKPSAGDEYPNNEFSFLEIILIISVELYVETEDANKDLIAYYKCGAGSASFFLVLIPVGVLYVGVVI